MYIEDLKPYTFLHCSPSDKVLAVGWLDDEHEFTRGNVPGDILDKILKLVCLNAKNVTRGFHWSPFPEKRFGRLKDGLYMVEYEGHTVALGSAEIHVRGHDGIEYRAPDLVYHYIKDCKYCPPPEFIEAVRAATIDRPCAD